MMTISYNPISNRVRVSIDKPREHTVEVPTSKLAAIAAVNAWGDVETLLHTAMQNPNCVFPVENKSNARGIKPRNYARYGIAQ